MKRRTGRVLLWVALALALLMVVPIGTNAMMQSFFSNKEEQTVNVPQEEYDRLQQYSTLDLMVDIIDNFFYQEPDTDAMIDYATHSILYATEDPGTRYIDEAEGALLRRAKSATTADIGVLLGWQRDNYLLRVRYVAPGSPADKADIRAGDYISGINGEYYIGFEQDLAEAMLRGEPDAEVQVTVYRDDRSLTYEEMVRELTLRLAVTEPAPTLVAEMLDDETGVIALLDIGEDTAKTFARTLAGLKDQGVKRLVLDLREAGGGTMEQLLPLAEQLLSGGEVAKLLTKEDELVFTVEGSEELLPMVALIGPYTSGMAEVLAGAMQRQDTAELVGQQTLGTGTVQEFFPLGEEGAGVYITTGAYRTSAGLEIRDDGVLPDEELKEMQRNTWLAPELILADDTALQQAFSRLTAGQEDTDDTKQ